MKSKQAYAGTQALMRAIGILKLFNNSTPQRSLREMVEETQLNRTTVYRLLSALESAGLVAYDALHDSYRLGSEMIALGAVAQAANPLRAVAHPHLQALAKKTGEMASIEVLEGNRTLILDEVKGAHQRKVGSSVGNLWHAHATSTGKLLLAYLPPDELMQTLDETLPQFTPQTIARREELLALLPSLRQQGYAIASNELEPGFTELAAPVYDVEGEVVAALSIGGATSRLLEQREMLLALLKKTAGELSWQLGYR